MTREEAISVIKARCSYCGFFPICVNDKPKCFSATEMAIKALQEPKWIPCSERMPDEDHWLGGSGKQFSDSMFVTVVNRDDEDTWTDLTHTVDGKWMLALPKHCEVVAWMPPPEPYKEEPYD